MEKRLGKGLDALIMEGGDSSGRTKEKIEHLNVTSILPNPHQPRKNFAENEMKELIDSIKEKGLIQPVLVRPAAEGYELIAGERRLRAAEHLELKKVPAIVRRNISDEESLHLAIIENVQREQLNPIEEAGAYQELVGRFGHTLQDVGRMMGKDKSTISNSLRILSLPREIRDMLAEGALSTGHAKALLALPSERKRLQIARKIIRESLSVRQAEQLIKRLGAGRTKSRPAEERDPQLRQLEDRLREKLGTKVSIVHGKKRGKVEIQYYSLEDLNRVLDLIL